MTAPYSEIDYIQAMVVARRERDEYHSQLMSASIDAHEWLETLARAVGIQTGRESWWDISEEEKREKVLERIARLKPKRLRAVRESEPEGTHNGIPK